MGKLADELSERSKRDDEMIVGSEIRAALQELCDEAQRWYERYRIASAEHRSLVEAFENMPEPESVWPPNPLRENDLKLWADIRDWYYSTRNLVSPASGAQRTLYVSPDPEAVHMSFLENAVSGRRDPAGRAEAERQTGPLVTCPASRHVHIMADQLMEFGGYPMFKDEPEHCAESLYAVITSLWKARHELAPADSRQKHPKCDWEGCQWDGKVCTRCPADIRWPSAADSRLALTSCQSDCDGDCTHPMCPQNRDGEPVATGRSCPLWVDHDDC